MLDYQSLYLANNDATKAKVNAAIKDYQDSMVGTDMEPLKAPPAALAA